MCEPCGITYLAACSAVVSEVADSDAGASCTTASEAAKSAVFASAAKVIADGIEIRAVRVILAAKFIEMILNKLKEVQEFNGVLVFKVLIIMVFM